MPAHRLRQAGKHAVPIRTEGWPEGTYFARLEAGNTTRTEKFIVLK